jgi:hypothetical protein
MVVIDEDVNRIVELIETISLSISTYYRYSNQSWNRSGRTGAGPDRTGSDYQPAGKKRKFTG